MRWTLARWGWRRAARRANAPSWGALAFVTGATILDVLTARGLDRQTGKLLPLREAAQVPANA